jgi:Type III restriction enzyme, res subunit
MDQFAPNEVDFIIVDEFHHATAATYRLLIGYFAPKFLFGQTATPGRSILASCHTRKTIRTIPAVCARLVTALFLDSGYTDEKETARKGHALGQDIQPPPKNGAIQLLYMHCYPCCKNHHQKVKKIAPGLPEL